MSPLPSLANPWEGPGLTEVVAKSWDVFFCS